MNITIGITGLDNLAESINNLADALRAGAKAEEVIQKASRKAKKTEQATTEPVGEVKGATLETVAAIQAHVDTPPVVEETKVAEPEPVSECPSKLTAADVKQALLKLVREKGHPAGAAVLQQFGGSKISDIKEDDFEAFIEAAVKALA